MWVYSLNTTCYSFSNGIYYTLSDMFRPIYNGHIQASVLGGVVNTIAIRAIRDLVSFEKTYQVVLDSIPTYTIILVIVITSHVNGKN
jgi:hypothetical protein